MSSTPGWEGLQVLVEALERAISRSSAVNVNAAALRSQARELVQHYFREARPELIELELPPDDVRVLDAQMQTLLQLANGRNAKTSYTSLLRATRQTLQALEPARERRIGETRSDSPRAVLSQAESRILETLRELAPTAALSYEQVIRDLADSANRVSWRGTANELRETLREVLDKLAPDATVIASDGFKFERGMTTPTHKQKVRHILRSRDIGSTLRKTPEDAASLVDELIASITRAAYDRGSMAAHVASTEREIKQAKMYADSVLAELLEIHG